MGGYFCYLIASIYSVAAIITPTGAVAYDGQKMYISEEDIQPGVYDDLFHIHAGENQWYATTIIIEDETGMYTGTSSIVRDSRSPENVYEKKWKCPYCYHYWPIGTPCQNPDCPSKYKS